MNRPMQIRKVLLALLVAGVLMAVGMFTWFFILARPSAPGIPKFDHVLVIVLENREYEEIIGNPAMPFFNQAAQQNVLLSEYHGIRHPSLPNYIALITGDTHGITEDCNDCYLDVSSLPEQIENSARTWKGYLEDIPEPCFQDGNAGLYAKRHNPFVYIDHIRLNEVSCKQSVVGLAQLESDLARDTLPHFGLIAPNVCNDSHDCGLDVTDAWLAKWVPKIMANPSMGKNSLLVITFDEGSSDKTCCGLTTQGGRVATVLISPHAQKGFVDATPYSHYSLLKTIETAWDLPLLGHAADASARLILDPWIQKEGPLPGWMP